LAAGVLAKLVMQGAAIASASVLGAAALTVAGLGAAAWIGYRVWSQKRRQKQAVMTQGLRMVESAVKAEAAAEHAIKLLPKQSGILTRLIAALPRLSRARDVNSVVESHRQELFGASA
jgi:hypothetical protein